MPPSFLWWWSRPTQSYEAGGESQGSPYRSNLKTAGILEDVRIADTTASGSSSTGFGQARAASPSISFLAFVMEMELMPSIVSTCDKRW